MNLKNLVTLIQDHKLSRNKNYEEWTQKTGLLTQIESAKLLLSILNDLEKGCELKMDKQQTNVKVELFHPDLLYKRISYLTFEEASTLKSF